MFHFYPALGRTFKTQYKCFSVSMMPGSERPEVEEGGKIILPPTALELLSRLNIDYPMLFKLQNKRKSRVTNCGVLEFIAEEGKCYIPYWMMKNLLLEEGELVDIESVSLPSATFGKFQPQSADFLDITNPKAVLENSLRNFACLTCNDVIAIHYNDRVYELLVVAVEPPPAVSIIKCDMNVEFEKPVGYKEPEVLTREQKEQLNEQERIDAIKKAEQAKLFHAFQGRGNRLDGEKKNTEANPKLLDPSKVIERGIPNYDYKPGKINFIRSKTSTGAEKRTKTMKAMFLISNHFKEQAFLSDLRRNAKSNNKMVVEMSKVVDYMNKL